MGGVVCATFGLVLRRNWGIVFVFVVIAVTTWFYIYGFIDGLASPGARDYYFYLAGIVTNIAWAVYFILARKRYGIKSPHDPTSSYRGGPGEERSQ